MEMKNLQINIKINPKCDSDEDIRDLIFSLIEESNNSGFAIDSASIDGEQVFESLKGFVNCLQTK